MSTTWLCRFLLASTIISCAATWGGIHSGEQLLICLFCNATNCFLGGVLLERRTFRKRLERLVREKD